MAEAPRRAGSGPAGRGGDNGGGEVSVGESPQPGGVVMRKFPAQGWIRGLVISAEKLPDGGWSLAAMFENGDEIKVAYPSRGVVICDEV